jgi:hypothetical protein
MTAPPCARCARRELTVLLRSQTGTFNRRPSPWQLPRSDGSVGLPIPRISWSFNARGAGFSRGSNGRPLGLLNIHPGEDHRRGLSRTAGSCENAGAARVGARSITGPARCGAIVAAMPARHCAGRGMPEARRADRSEPAAAACGSAPLGSRRSIALMPGAPAAFPVACGTAPDCRAHPNRPLGPTRSPGRLFPRNIGYVYPSGSGGL